MELTTLYGKPLQHLYQALPDKVRPKPELFAQRIAKTSETTVRQGVLRTLAYGSVKFSDTAFKVGGKIYVREKDLAKADALYVDFLADKAITDTIQPPVKANVIATSKPLKDWSAYIFHARLSLTLFARPLSEVPTKVVENQASINKFLSELGIEYPEGLFQQSTNKIVTNVLARIHGEVAKYKAKEEALAEKGQKPDKPLFNDEAGTLFYPPGVEQKLYLSQSYKAGPLDLANKKHQEIFQELCKRVPQLSGYSLRPDDAIPFGVGGSVPDRSRLPQYRMNPLSMWSKAEKTCGKRLKLRGDAALQGAILGVAIDRDGNWVVYDMRGMLRQVRYRLAKRRMNKKAGVADYRCLTLSQLHDHFTGDPVASLIPQRNGTNYLTFCFQQGICIGNAKDVIEHTRPLRNLVGGRDNDELVVHRPVVSIDLGANQPLAARVSTYSLTRGQEQLRHHKTLTWDDVCAGTRLDFKVIRDKYDRDMEALYAEAYATLPDDVRLDVSQRTNAPEARQKLEKMLGLDLGSLRWDLMSGISTQVYDAAIGSGKWTHEQLVALSGWDKRNPKKKVGKDSKYDPKTPTDKWWAGSVRHRTNPENTLLAAKAFREVASKSPAYRKFAVRRQETLRQIASFIVAEAERASGLADPIIVLEELNLRMMNGKGKQASPGWDGFFAARKENRWLIQGIHKAFCDLAHNRGKTVMLVWPARTSITCTRCDHVDPENRDKKDKELFKCTKCGYEAHADIDIATTNIEKVAFTGRHMPRSEQPSDAKKPGGARKTKKTKQSST